MQVARGRGVLKQDLVDSLPPGVLAQIRDVFAVMAQQFRGYIFRQEAGVRVATVPPGKLCPACSVCSIMFR